MTEADIIRAVATLLGREVTEFAPRSGGLTHALTGVVTFDDAGSAFVKAGTEPYSAADVASEIRTLSLLEGDFLPRVIASSVDPPLLVLEDLSVGHWPEPYPADLSALEAVLAQVEAMAVPPGLDVTRVDPPGDDRVAAMEANAAVISADLAAWVGEHHGRLADAIGELPAGRVLVHGDLWYPNLCFLPDRVVIVDWAQPCLGPPGLDASTVSIDLVIAGRPPLGVGHPDAWAAAHLAWVLGALAEGAGPAISDAEFWESDNIELVDGAAWWFAAEAGVSIPPALSNRTVGY